MEKSKIFVVGRGFRKSIMTKKLFDYLKQLSTIERMKRIEKNDLDNTSKYLRYRFPEEDKPGGVVL